MENEIYREFPYKQPENITSFVKVIVEMAWSWEDFNDPSYFCYNAEVYAQCGTFLGHLSFLVGINTYTEQDIFISNFLERFSLRGFITQDKKYYHSVDKSCYRVKLETLLAGCQLFRKDREQFNNVLKTAETEEEFCVLAGLS